MKTFMGWVAANPDDSQSLFAIMASFAVTFLVVSVSTVAVVLLASNRFAKR